MTLGGGALRGAPPALVLVAFVVWPLGAAAQGDVLCLDAYLGDWSPVEGSQQGDAPRPPPPGEADDSLDSLSYLIPPRFHLEDAWASNGLVTVPENALQVPWPRRTWRREGDTLWIGLSHGLHGIHITVTPEADGWAGRARTSTDNIGTLLYERPVTLTAVSCRSEPPVPAGEGTVLRRTVELADGLALILGEPLPDGVGTTPRRGSWERVAAVEPAGVWAGVDTVIVRLDGGVVYEIELRYPLGFDASALMRQLTDEHGESMLETSMLFWMNRTTWVVVTHETTRPRVLLRDPRFDATRAP